VHDDGRAELLRAGERVGERRDVVAVDGTEILDVEVRVEVAVVRES